MTDISTNTAEQPEARKPITDLARKVMLATIGAAALAQEEAETFIKKLIERGEIAEKDGRKLIEDLKEKRSKKAGEVEGEFERRLSAALERMNVPTKADFEALSEKIAALAEKLDTIKKTQA